MTPLGAFSLAYKAGHIAGKRSASLHSNPHSPGRDRWEWLAGWHAGYAEVLIRKRGKNFMRKVDQCREVEKVFLLKAEQSLATQRIEMGE